jgi:hypothetical protein
MASISFVFVGDTPRPTITVQADEATLESTADTRPWVLIDNAGDHNELVIDSFDTFRAAVDGQRAHGSGDVVKRLADGSFTTEF